MKDMQFETAIRRIARLTSYIKQERAALAARSAEGQDTNRRTANLAALEYALTGLLRMRLSTTNIASLVRIVVPDLGTLVARSDCKNGGIPPDHTPAERDPFSKWRNEVAVIPRRAGQPPTAESIGRQHDLNARITMIDRLKRERLAATPTKPSKKPSCPGGGR